jgi:tryptophanyl-tRNA synthetase
VTDYIYCIAFDSAAPPRKSDTLTILACIGETPGVLTELERYVESNHGALKKDVMEVVDEGLRKPRAEFTRLRKEKEFLEQVAQHGAKRTQEHLDRTTN